MPAGRHLVTAVTLVAVTALAAGCSASSPAGVRTTAGSSASTPGGTASRWWSNGRDPVGSSVDLAHPAAAAAGLHRSRAAYCTMLRQTTAGSASVLAGVPAAGSRRAALTAAFFAEVEHVAPQPVAASWRTLGDGLSTLARTPKVGDRAALVRSAAAVAADAKSHCHLSLTRKS